MTKELAVKYLGHDLVSPVVIGACPKTTDPETVAQLVDAGVGAIVLPSMLQEQIEYENRKESDPLGAVSKLAYQPQQNRYNGGPKRYLDTISSLKRMTDIPVMANVNGSSDGDWIEYVKEIERAGADALELNLQPCVSGPNQTSNDVEARLCDMVRRITASLAIPVAVKVSRNFTNLLSMVRQLRDAGTRGVVLFSHAPQWDVCVDRKHWTIGWQLSPVASLGGIQEGLVRVRGGKFDLSIAASGGVCSGEDAIKAMIAGADIVMVTSILYREGIAAIREMVERMKWHVDVSPYATLQELLETRPIINTESEQEMRFEFVDPLTRCETYCDPAAVGSQVAGDAANWHSIVDASKRESDR